MSHGRVQVPGGEKMIEEVVEKREGKPSLKERSERTRMKENRRGK